MVLLYKIMKQQAKGAKEMHYMLMMKLELIQNKKLRHIWLQVMPHYLELMTERVACRLENDDNFEFLTSLRSTYRQMSSNRRREVRVDFYTDHIFTYRTNIINTKV